MQDFTTPGCGSPRPCHTFFIFLKELLFKTNNILIVLFGHFQHRHFRDTAVIFLVNQALLIVALQGQKTTRLLWAEHSLDFFSWFPRVHRSSRWVLCGSGAGFLVFSLGILHGMRLIVKGDFLTNISHILLKPPGLVRNQMTAWALWFGRRREVRAKQPCMSPQQRACFVVSVISAKRSRCSMKHCLYVSDYSADPEQEETISLKPHSDAVQTDTLLIVCSLR